MATHLYLIVLQDADTPAGTRSFPVLSATTPADADVSAYLRAAELWPAPEDPDAADGESGEEPVFEIHGPWSLDDLPVLPDTLAPKG